MLAYVRAAYVYFAETGAVDADTLEDALVRINAVIDESYGDGERVDVSGSTTLGTEGLSAATVQVGASVAFIFFPTEDPEAYTFT